MRLRHAYDMGFPFVRIAAMLSTRPWRFLQLGHDEAESEGLLLIRNEVFYSAAVMPPTRP